MDDIGLWELNEAFAVQVLYCQDKLGIPDDLLNVNGGAISIGHPYGMSGARLVGHALDRRQAPRREICRRHDVRRRRHGRGGTVRSAIVVAVPLRGKSMAFLFGLPIFVLVLLLVLSLKSFGINQEYQRAVLFRLGRLGPMKGPGWYWLIPFVDRVVRVDQRIITYQLETQETITRDGVAVRVNAVLWFRAESPVQVVTSVEDWMAATVQAAETALRDAIGQSDLDHMLKDRASINQRLQQLLREASLKWGVEIDSVEIKDVDIPEQMQRAIAKEAEAIREKRARIIRAEGEQEAARKLSEAAETISRRTGCARAQAPADA